MVPAPPTTEPYALRLSSDGWMWLDCLTCQAPAAPLGRYVNMSEVQRLQQLHQEEKRCLS